jgi:hypothetical protein
MICVKEKFCLIVVEPRNPKLGVSKAKPLLKARKDLIKSSLKHLAVP